LYSGITVSLGMEKMPSQITLDKGLKAATLTLDLPCSELVTHSGEMPTAGKSHKKKPDRFSSKDNTEMKR
jgi:hypothetical protein